MRARPPRLPGYVLGARLGGGPTCDVFTAFDAKSGRSRAIKILRDDAAEDPTNVQLLSREIEAGISTRHPNLVRILAGSQDSARPYHVVMELARGQSLGGLLRREGWLNPQVVGNIGIQVAGALAELHGKGFVHSDVKPDNLHLAPGPWATVLDLGFAHRPGHESGLPGSGFVLGTANYVAPELCDQSDRDGFATDIFSFGVTLFELLTGELPYPTGDVEETMVQHRDALPESLWDWQGQWPVGLSALVDSMLSREPKRRPTATTVRRELELMFQSHRQPKRLSA